MEVLDPAVLFQERQKKIDLETKKSFKALMFGGGEVEWTGELSFPDSTLTFRHEVNYNKVKTSIPLSALREITVKEWNKKNLSRNEYAFYPARYEIVYEMEGKTKQVVVKENLDALNRLTFAPEGKSSGGKETKKNYLYTYFVDYLRGDIWANSGVTNKRLSRVPPPDPVIRKIVFQK